VGYTSDAIARFVVLRDLGTKGDDCAGEVAADCGAWCRKDFVVDVLPGEA
jgi:hypothetical protein